MTHCAYSLHRRNRGPLALTAFIVLAAATLVNALLVLAPREITPLPSGGYTYNAWLPEAFYLPASSLMDLAFAAGSVLLAVHVFRLRGTRT